ncbi:hypothetical protein BDZ45DRAFT_234475 [Acephala macrosclerotiorum]|nr:hypothetical protein BDZ45DRAFT_234475 [Acephala macrosclerotiorum]
MLQVEMRRVHKKTRTGCTQCKRRKVKCDQRKPSCASCKRQNRKCSLEFLTPMAFPSHGAKDSRIMSAPKLSLELSPSSFDPLTNELLHHYTTALYASLADDCTPSV